MGLGKPMHAQPGLSELVSPVLPLKLFCCRLDWWWPCLGLTMALSLPFSVDLKLLSFCSPLSSRRSIVWYVHSFVPSVSASSSSTFQVFQSTSLLQRLFCLPVLSLSHLDLCSMQRKTTSAEDPVLPAQHTHIHTEKDDSKHSNGTCFPIFLASVT